MTYSFRTNGNFIDFVHTDNTSLQVESVLRSLHNTSRCVTWSLPDDTTRISFVVDDIRVDGFLLSEIDFDGVAIDSQDDFETGITAMFTGLEWGGGSSYLVYTALISQSGTNPPSVLILENTTGEVPIWSYSSTGYYILTFSQEIAALYNTWFSIQPSVDAAKRITIDQNDNFSIYVATYNVTTLANGVLSLTSIEIRLYNQ